MITYPALKNAFTSLGLITSPVIAHASMRSFGEAVDGGPQMVVQAMARSFRSLIMPSHTYKTMVTPAAGPANNAMTYGKPDYFTSDPEIFYPTMPADKLMGIIPETLRNFPGANRSMHPILSFVGVNADLALGMQTLQDPLAPISVFAQQNGWVVLVGVTHTSNTSIHFIERLAGRKQFTRWALTRDTGAPAEEFMLSGRNFVSHDDHARIVECPSFPGCSAGFQVIMPDMEKYVRRTKVGQSLIMAVPLAALMHVVLTKLRENPLSLLCYDQSCLRCAETRRATLEKRDNEKPPQL